MPEIYSFRAFILGWFETTRQIEQDRTEGKLLTLCSVQSISSMKFSTFFTKHS
ncbi:hypothetical protein NHJ6243_008947 [Beauveria neobassiana]